MSADANTQRKMTSIFERYLSVWVLLCIVGGILLGKVAPGVARTLDQMAIFVNGAPVVSIPIAVCLFFMRYPIMVKIDFGEVIKAGKSGKPAFLTLFINWAVKPFTMYAIALFFLGTLVYNFIGPEAVDQVKMPFGLDLPVGAGHGAGTVVLVDGIKMLGNPLTILWIAVPLFIQTVLIFCLGYGLAKMLKLRYEDTAPSAMIGASNHFEVAIATSTMLFGLSSGAALATVVGVLIEVPVMLMLVKICLATRSWFIREGQAD
jgi:ACR3 family arsenite efflux pump ArsB